MGRGEGILKILNLYAGLGGNRKLWGNEHEITAVENNGEIAAYYKEHYPKDTLIIGDVITLLENNPLDVYDFIWASPPCPTHSKLAICNKKRVPDMTSLYGIQIFLDRYYDGLYAIENVHPYHLNNIMIDSHLTKLGRHCFWSNFPIPYREFKKTPKEHNSMTITSLGKWKGIDPLITGDRLNDRQYIRNCVHPKIGKYILDCAMKKVRTLDSYIADDIP